MGMKQAFKLALKSLASNKMRSFLTMLGIIIGVAAVIILVSVMNGFSNMITDQFNSLGTNLINVTVMGRGSSRSVSVNDMMEFGNQNLDVISYISPTVNSSGTIKNGTDSVDSSITGCNEFYDRIRSLEIGQGRFLQYLDIDRNQKVCVIGTYQQKELFDGQSAVGEKVSINGDSYIVVGVLAEKAESEEGSSDDIVYIPYTMAQRLSGNGQVNSYAVSALSSETASQAGNRVKTFLYEKFGNENAYRVMNMSEMLDMVDTIMGTISMVLIGIAAISLLVGGIGIMNIMLVSVTERTREIGIRKSLGAKQRDILRQFLIEAATTSIVGGVLGIIIGMTGAGPLARLADLEASFSLASILIAVGVSGGIGVIFGYFPARRASGLNPIDALRYE